MKDRLRGNAVVGQSGGPTAAINATLAGVIKGALECDAIKTLYGMRNGVEGLLEERLVDLTKYFENDELITKLENTPAAALGSCRKKMKSPEVEPETYEKLLEIFKKYNIRYFFYNGGNDSMDTCNKISKFMQKSGYEMRVMGVPKTIDNDLFGTDHCPGYGSAAKYVATSTMEVYHDARVYDTGMVTVLEVMGRHAGYIALNCGIAAGATAIAVPEVSITVDEIVKKIEDARNTGKKHFVIVVAEGVGGVEEMAKEIETRTGIESRATVLGHVQRGGTPTVRDRLRATQMANAAVHLLANGIGNRVVAYKDNQIVDYDIFEALNMTKEFEFET